MSDRVQMSCEPEMNSIPLTMRMLDAGLRNSVKFKCIEASVKELGLIEPLVVYPQPDSDGSYILLDGHVRHVILKDLRHTHAKCLIAKDDEGFTYNHKVSRLTAIQEHFMIMRAIKNGVSESRIARSLDVNIGTIRQKRDMLDGICPEAIQLLRDRRATHKVFHELRKAKPCDRLRLPN